MLLRHINYFLAVAEYRSFTRAATSLYVSQPALSQQIKQLEEQLGCQLFDRSGRSVRLTDAGEMYARYARNALQDLQEGKRAINDVKNLSSGELRIAITPTFTTYLIGPLIKVFHERYPKVTLSVKEMSQEQMEQRLLDDEFDVGIAFENVHSADIESQTLLVETLALVVRKDHPLAQESVVNLQILNQQSMVLLSNEFATREQIERYCRQHQVQPKVLMEANSLSAVIEIVRNTQLATLLPSNITGERDELVAITLTPSLLQRTAVLLQRKGAYQTAAAKAFITLAHQHCQPDNSVESDSE
ncbi:transcriptional regulator CynR [Shewanella vesiculosa]|uniref:Transcriptional regulator CynR n=1 Tax=Shewanella vesiculosa TaxID=518738 RepID=A0ABV0FSH9_9GAMM|nr:transcriptional regulator CynR [Shewanella vesiculosa]RPA51088.1 transcriptional regulator CynR [Shewanella vesiculosa]UJL42136.1 transcriptional regulator CynR [Shewanella vesiculosa]